MSASLEPHSLRVEDLAPLRAKTEVLSHFLNDHLRDHVETIRSLLAPRRIFGRYVGGTDLVTGSDRAFQLLQEQFRGIAPAFGLAPEMTDGELRELDHAPEVYPWEYTYDAKTDQTSKTLTITSPVRWVLTYRSGYSLSQFRQTVTTTGERVTRDLRAFILCALMMQMLLKGHPKLMRLLQDLRYEVTFESLPGLKTLPLPTVHACLPSFRPADPLLLMATGLSGVPAFIELIDLDRLRTLDDPFKAKLESLARA